MTFDRELIAAEQRLAAIKSGPRTGSVAQEIERLEDLIDETAPDGLAGAAVKLRRLADPEQLLINTGYDRGLAETSARQILVAVEKTLAAPPLEIIDLGAESVIAAARALAQLRTPEPDPFLAALPEYNRVHGLAIAALACLRAIAARCPSI